ncbi:MAG: DUF2971 domain-containing protein [Clostridiales bacterium]|nr:DUF2971 domain-containing protein [Clostridiales bacterium]
MNNIIYHYTTVGVLALILQNKTIRFNSLKNVDDMLDGSHNDVKNARNYLFVSCWSEDNHESIPLWKMYSDNMSGIRIGINRDLIKPLYKYVTNGKSVIKTRKIINITNNSLYCFTDNFKVKVKYDDYEQHKLIKLINLENEELNSIEYTKLAGIKKKCWNFQNETRFVLLATLSDGDGIFDKQNSIESLYNGLKKSNVEYIDMIFDDAVFSDMEILIGPNASPASKIIIESLINKFLPSFCGKIEHSNLLIRKQ